MISDNFGAATPSEEEFVADMQEWVVSRARRLCQSPTALSKVDDVMQEGRIELWRAYRELKDDPDRLHRTLSRAHFRMKAVAWGDPRLVGAEPRAAHTREIDSESLDRLQEAGVTDLLAAVDSLSDIEIAYHYGEIAKAFSELTPKQQKYVYARFWCGMDATDLHMNPGMRAARKQNPILSRDNLWAGTKAGKSTRATPGAKKVLAEKLAHLHDLVRT